MHNTSQPRWLTPGQLRAWRSFSLMTSRLMTALDTQLQRDNKLSYVEYYALAGLSEQPGWTMRISRLAVFVNAELSRMSHLIKRLEGRGLVRREPDPADGRYTNAILTDLGHRLLVEAAPGHVAAVRKLLIDVLDERALATLEEISEQIIICTEDSI